MSVHLQQYPKIDSIEVNQELITAMDKVRQICASGLSFRSSKNIRIRQPLDKIEIYSKDIELLKPFKDIIIDELNIKNIVFNDNIKDVADYKLKINFPILGKRLPAKMKDIIKANKASEWSLEAGSVNIAGEILKSEEYQLNLKIKDEVDNAEIFPDNDGLMIFDVEVTRDLYLEGISRDIIRFIQRSRADKDLDISSKINIKYNSDNADIKEAISAFKRDICYATLSENIDYIAEPGELGGEIAEANISISIAVITS